MCISPAALMLISTVGQAVVGTVGARQQARAQVAANQAQAKAILQARNENLAAVGRQASQMQTAAGDKLFRERVRAMEARSTAQASGEGISGMSVAALLDDLTRREFNATTSVEANYMRDVTELNLGEASIYNNAISQTNALPAVNMPNYLTAAFQIADGVAGYNNSTKKVGTTDLNNAVVPDGRGGFVPRI